MGSIHKRWELLQLYRRRFGARSIGASVRALLKVWLIPFHVRRLWHGETKALTNFYFSSASRGDEVRFCKQILGCDQAQVEEAFEELEQDRAFVERLCKRYERVRPDCPVRFSIGRFKVWYAVVRLLRPRIVVETGVHDGLSSALVLRAMSRNDRGCLVSIDLPAWDLPIGVDGAGWLIPDDLKSRWRLNVGDARELLPNLAKQYAPIDLFIHDSDHTAEFQSFEYRTVKPFLSRGGLLLTDDAIPEMFCKLAAEWGAEVFLVAGAAPETGIILGGIRFHHPTAHADSRQSAARAGVS